jgi:predicted small metal-binding protein
MRNHLPGCNFVAHADSEDELMIVAATHANSVHGVDHLSEPLKAKIRSVIRDALADQAGARITKNA